MKFETMQPHQQRVVTEKAELDEKLEKLNAFTTTRNPAFATLAASEITRLLRQRDIMAQYSAVLAERIAAFPAASG